MPLSPRQASAKLLSELDFSKINVSGLLELYSGRVTDQKLLTELVYGVVRNTHMLDAVIEKSASINKNKCKAFVMNLLRGGCYEMLFCGGQPLYATVNETVKAAGKRRERGFVNAVLRNISRNIDGFVSIEEPDTFSSRRVPVDAGNSVIFKSDVFPDSHKDKAGWISQVFSLPRFAVEGWIKDYGFDKTVSIALGLNRRPSIYLRANRLKTDAQSLCELMRERGIHAEKVTCTEEGEEWFGDFISVVSPGRVSSLPGFDEGLFTVQDLTAGRLAHIIAPKQDDIIVDLCAAPGTKTTHLAELMSGKGKIYAADINPTRAEKIIPAAQRLGLQNIEVMDYQSLLSSIPEIKPSIILLDVPCSNTGVMARRTELRHRLSEKGIKSLIKTQLNILQTAADKLNYPCRLCYSTCSISKMENKRVIEQFITKNHSWKLTCDSLTLPSCLNPDFDGGYVALLSR
ncbi:Ribosomal RNA small subunit methyltransferase B [Limihaloglobus sulfuriphilus]|uniref:Ribosomal RNA small subunit methyltransferase B n=1 Tax=Limihaloglobus sulfuriphilus TaxID=1851148 RepID=A0A1Q2MIT1_9BACT|nr:transcription antitermination factor NusB [Limihaloglobus sulfuriphilus]AQQ72601.1 Ribosomal RNA small subunit methyltransferase B [Limihaloglobus sulfuriphilus]